MQFSTLREPMSSSAPKRCTLYLQFLGLLMAVLFFCQPAAFSQSASGSISGTVTDATGAVVPGATVTLMDLATNVKRETISNSKGVFSFPSILPATYSVSIAAAGFSTWEQKGITLTQGGSLSLPGIVLQIQTSKQEVQIVSANEMLVPVDSGQAS